MICHSVDFLCYYPGKSPHSLCWISCFPNHGFPPVWDFACLKMALNLQSSLRSHSVSTQKDMQVLCLATGGCLRTRIEKRGLMNVGVCFSDKYIDFHLIPLFPSHQLPLRFSVLAVLSPGSLWFMFARNQSEVWELGRERHQLFEVCLFCRF